MRKRTLRLMASMFGFQISLGEVIVEKFAKVREANTVSARAWERLV